MNAWSLLILLALIGVAMLLTARGFPRLTGELQLYRKEEHNGHDSDVLIVAIPLHRRFRTVALDQVDPRIPGTTARVFVIAHRSLLTGVVRLRVSVRFPALRRWASRDLAEGDRLLILGLDVRHVRPQQIPPTLTVPLTEPN